MSKKRYLYWATVSLSAAAGVALMTPLWQPVAAPAPHGPLHAPRFQVDPFWPRPLPDNWVTGEIGGTCMDSRDHLFVVTRGFQNGGLTSPEGVAGQPTKSRASPPVIEFDRK